MTANPTTPGQIRLTVMDGYSGLRSTLPMDIVYIYSQAGIYGAIEQVSGKGTNMSYGVELRTAPGFKVRILSATLLSKQNRLMAFCNIGQKSDDYVLAYTDRINTLDLFGVQSPYDKSLDGLKFLVTYTLNGKESSEYFEVEAGERVGVNIN